MKRRSNFYIASMLLITFLLFISCTIDEGAYTPTPMPVEKAEPAQAPPPKAGPELQPEPETTPPQKVELEVPQKHKTTLEHRIGVRTVDGLGEFYDRKTGKKFIPRGNNYIRLGMQSDYSGCHIFYHTAFNSNTYDPARAEQVLEQMHRDGYNVVRVFLNPWSPTGLGGQGDELSPIYLDNVVDFLYKTRTKDIYVIFAIDGLPPKKYTNIINTANNESFSFTNADYLSSAGVYANQLFYQDFIRGLITRDAPLDAVLAYGLRNELFFMSTEPPLSLTSGMVMAANGKIYDMASEENKRQMIDECLVYWINSVRDAILEVDSTALITVGFFWPQEPHPARLDDPRVIETRSAIWESSLDFIDLHPYPGVKLELAEYVDNYKMSGMDFKPILMGEFGATRSAYSSTMAAARALHNWQVESCKYGFDGWLLWNWDCDEQNEFYNGLIDGGLINQALAPVNRPNPCQPGSFSFFENNLSFNKPTQASRFLPDQPPSGAVDGDNIGRWNAGDYPPQWIEIDLGKSQTIRLIRLIVSQYPTGYTVHQVWGGVTQDQLQLLHEFQGHTANAQVLEFNPPDPIVGIRYIRILTTQSPSWVSWKEIEVIK